VEYAEPEKSGIRFNLTQEELVRTFSTPFTSGQQFWFMGRLLSSLKVVKAVLFWSYETADKLFLPNQENLIVAKDKKYLIDSVIKGKVKGAYLCTEKYLPPVKTTPSASSSSIASGIENTRKRIFVISGSDVELKQSITTALSKLGLVPVVMREQPSQGRKLVERYADYSDIGFAIVLLSPDDFAYEKNESPTKRYLQPHQDVIFALGFFLGKLTKENVISFYIECSNFKAPTDFEGIKSIAFDDRDSWKLALIRELTAAGYTVDADRILK
jgi:predicted nucleotide-binding protein